MAKSGSDIELARHKADEQEAEMARKLRNNAERAIEIEADLLEKAANAQPRDVPQALRAVADVKAKSVDKLMALTGRAPSESGADLGATLASLAGKGFLRMNVELGRPEPDAVDADVVEDEPSR